MTLQNDGTGFREISFSETDFRAIASLALKEFGLNLAESKKPLVYSRLSKRLKARSVNNFSEYLSLLQGNNEQTEKLELISALTTNVTSFFREKHHFDTLSRDVLPTLQEKLKSGQRVRIWSAGCSSGQEPYSIAMTILDHIPDAKEKNVKILATDIDPKIVEKAKSGEYTSDEISGIPESFRKKWIHKYEEHKCSISNDLRSIVTFAELNLMEEWPFTGPFDAIFCRNVAIYFNQETQKKLWDRFQRKLTHSGYLFIGHSERVSGPAAEHLAGVGITSYQNIETKMRSSSQ